MPDIDPAALSSRPSVGLSTPVLKQITVSTPATQKITKTSQIIPTRIDLEPLYASLKAAIGLEQWNAYKDSTTQFILGPYLLLHPPAPLLSMLTSARPRSVKPGRILRAYRPDPGLPQWRERPSP